MSDIEQLPSTPKPKRVYKKRTPEINPEPQHLAPEPVTPEPIAPSQKQKRERSEKQILAFKKMQEKRKEQDELKKLSKSIEKDKQVHDNHSTKVAKLKEKIITSASSVIPDDIELDEPSPIVPKKRSYKPRAKKIDPVDDEEYSPQPDPPTYSKVSTPVKYVFL